MNCLAEERFVELLDQGGLDSARPEERAHLETCDGCRDSWASVAAAGEILTEARPRTPGRASRLIPLLAAAAMLLAILGVIVLRQKPPQINKPPADPVTMFLEGTPEEYRSAREMLQKGGKDSLLRLSAARSRFKGSPRFKALEDLIFDLKVAAARQDPADLAVFRKLETMKIALSFEGSKVEDILAFLRDFSGLNLVADPGIDTGSVETLNLADSTLRSALEVLCAVKGLDFDLRYGVLFISTPLRIWSTEPGVGLPAANQWRKQTLSRDEAAAAQKLQSIRITIDMLSAPVRAIADYLTGISSLNFKVDASIPETPVFVHARDLDLTHAIELLTLPFGLDVRIEGATVRIFAPKK